MMKNYFESGKCIVPFDKVINIDITKKNEITVFTGFHIYVIFPIEQLDDYKQWLDNQSPDAGKMVEQSSSETPNNWKPSIEQIEQIAKFIKEPCSCCNFYDIGLDAYKDKCDGCCYDKFDMNVLRYAELISKLEGK